MAVVELFQDFQRIFGLCPCCGEPFRLSDAGLYFKAPPPPSPWDELDVLRDRLVRAQERLANDEDRLREQARTDGQLEIQRRLRSLTGYFRRRRIDLRDVNLLFHPIDYVAFRGLSEGRCTSVEFLDHEPDTARHEKLQRSIDTAIRAGNVEWLTMRITDDGSVKCS